MAQCRTAASQGTLQHIQDQKHSTSKVRGSMQAAQLDRSSSPMHCLCQQCQALTFEGVTAEVQGLQAMQDGPLRNQSPYKADALLNIRTL